MAPLGPCFSVYAGGLMPVSVPSLNDDALQGQNETIHDLRLHFHLVDGLRRIGMCL